VHGAGLHALVARRIGIVERGCAWPDRRYKWGRFRSSIRYPDEGRLGLRLCALGVLFLVALAAGPARAQEETGTKVIGTLGLCAGCVPKPGISIQGMFIGYSSGALVDRNGHELPVNIALAAHAGVLGVEATFELPSIKTYLTAAIGVPLARVSGVGDRPQASIDKYGLGDLHLRPMELGWKLPQAEIVAAYTMYIPTGSFEPGGNDGVGSGNLTQEASLGGTVYFDRAKQWRLSALASLEVNGRKRAVDIKRGASVQVQGGIGAEFFRIFEIGVAGYALWQVTDDTGSDLPDVLRGARDRAYGLGPEIGVDVVPLRSRLTVRYEHDLMVASRPFGQVLVLQLAVLAWSPRPPEH
jgi:hypothetical protein